MLPNKKRRAPVRPGDILARHFIAGHEGLTPHAAARAMRVRPSVVYDVIRGRRAITAPLALRLGRLFGTRAHFWLGLQAQYDLELAEREEGARVRDEVRRLRHLPPPQRGKASCR
ncbi:MAG TPA: HigA family addiction module antitoxin [Rudaea sp.]|nr:HigA family addiction module antitoxin [Rudaea sp.]